MSLAVHWPIGMRWRRTTRYEQQVEALLGGRSGGITRELTTLSAVVGDADGVLVTEESLETFLERVDGQPAHEAATLAGLGAVFRVTWRDGVAVLREPVSGPPEAADLAFGGSYFPGCPRPPGPVRVNDAWTQADPLDPSTVVEARLVSIDAAVGTASVECTSQAVVPQTDGATMRLRARDEIAIDTGLSLRVTCEVTLSTERFRSTTRSVTERAPL